MACAVKAVEMTHRAMTPGRRDVDARAGAQARRGGQAEPDERHRGQDERDEELLAVAEQAPDLEPGLGERCGVAASRPVG